MEKLKKYLSYTIAITALVLVLVISAGNWIVNAGNDGRSLEDYTNPTKTFYDTSYYDADHLFKAAGHFHLFASDQISLRAHCNGNFAAPIVDVGANTGTNQVDTANGEREMSYVDIIKCSSLVTQTADFVLGKKNTTLTDKNGPLSVGPISENQIYINGAQMNIAEYQKIYLAPEHFIDFTTEFSYLREVSAALAKQSPTLKKGVEDDATKAGTYNLDNHNTAYIHLSDGVNVVNCTISEISATGKLDIMGMLCNKNSNEKQHSYKGTQSLIINVDCKGTTTASPGLETKYHCQCKDGWPHGHGEENYYPGSIVIWNFYDSSKANKLYTGKLTPTNTVDGCYLVPNGDIAPASNTNGTLIGKNITITAESHRADFMGKTPKLDITTVTPTKSPSPSPKPTTKPTATPSNKPSATPSNNPSATPTTTPSKQPDATDAPNITPTPAGPHDTDVPTTQTPKETPQATTPSKTATPTPSAVVKATPSATPKGENKKPETPSDNSKKKSPKKGNLIITVTDSKTGKVVPNATVKITKPNGEVKNYTTNKKGQITLKKTAVGKYKGVVTKVPKGYHADRTKFTSKVKAATTTKEKVKIKTAVSAGRKTTNTNSRVSSNTATNSSQPQTGDKFDIRIPLALFLFAFVGIIAAIILKKRSYYYYN